MAALRSRMGDACCLDSAQGAMAQQLLINIEGGPFWFVIEICRTMGVSSIPPWLSPGVPQNPCISQDSFSIPASEMASTLAGSKGNAHGGTYMHLHTYTLVHTRTHTACTCVHDSHTFLSSFKMLKSWAWSLVAWCLVSLHRSLVLTPFALRVKREWTNICWWIIH